jgi:hypothetical protein
LSSWKTFYLNKPIRTEREFIPHWQWFLHWIGQERQVIKFRKSADRKAKYFYLNNTKTPAYLEPDGSDFFSPSLEIADLMRRVLPQKEFVQWLIISMKNEALRILKKFLW